MFQGFFALDGTLTLYLLTKNGEAPAAADAAPTYRIYGPSGLMTSGTGTSTAGDQTGLYKISHSLASGNGYAAGTTYSVLVSYAISAANKGQTFSFTVV